MAIDYTGFKFGKKTTPRVLEKKAKRTAIDSQDKAAKKVVRARDKSCRICLFRRSTEVHELVPKSKGGKASNFNSIGICGAANGGLCHSLIQQHAISYTFLKPLAGADGPMKFEMNASTARAVFGQHVVPKHVKVTS